MRILIYGAGVIGCLYAALFSDAGYDVSIYARGRRLASLRENGLLLRRGKRVRKADVNVIDTLEKGDCYDFIFLTVRENQLENALSELADNISPTIVTMVNTLEPYAQLEKLCGSGRILPAFPGAGGSFDGDVLEAELTPAIIQPTTFGEIDGNLSPRAKNLRAILRKSGIPHQIVSDMHVWQLCHLAKSAGMVLQEANIGPFVERSKDFSTARKMGYVKGANSTWHHQDGVTLQEVSTFLHERFRHRGGISALKGKS